MSTQPSMRMPDDLTVPQGSFWHKMPILGLIFGVAGLGYWATGFYGDEKRHLFGYLFAFVCVLSIALGCLVFVLLQHLTRAGWSVVVRRIAEFGAASMPLIAILFIPIALGAKEIFPWVHVEDSIIAAKSPYLNISFFMVRAVGYFVVWIGLGAWLLRSSISQDTGNNANESKKQWGVSAPGIIFYALSVTFASIDWMMSLQPHWYSTMFGVTFFAGCFLAGLSFMTLMIMGLQRSGALTISVTVEHYHDLGKLMFAFTVFWAYTAFSQFMLYWYANMPEEVEFMYHRLQHGWEWISYALIFTNFFIPFFFLLSRHVKRKKLPLAIYCVWIMVFHFVHLFWNIMPNAPGEHEGAPAHAAITAHDLAALLGMLALFVAFVSFFAIRQKVAPAGDPRLKESLAFENF